MSTRRSFTPLALVLAAAGLVAVGCEPSVDRGATSRAEPAAAAETKPGRTTVQGSGSAYGKARDAAERTTDKIAQQQRDLEKKIDELNDG